MRVPYPPAAKVKPIPSITGSSETTGARAAGAIDQPPVPPSHPTSAPAQPQHTHHPRASLTGASVTGAVRLGPRIPLQRLGLWGSSLFLGLLTWGGTALPSFSQTAPGSSLPACNPPAPGEYLLLVLTPDAASQNSLRQALPPSVAVPACDYLGNTVSRMGGFRNPEDATAWADYIQEVANLQSFVARPPSTAPNTPPSPPIPTTRTFNPQLLGPGYAVLVDYGNDPAVAQRLRQARQRTPGLVSFGQRPYLLTFQSTDSNQALALLADLNRQGFKALVVNSQGVVLLTDQVKGLP
ncbi:MAG: hypothetical protein VKJ85_12140 [Prochlorothrix sp.]|nr:hypothetical protein [Prochlorothrix sp.]